MLNPTVAVQYSNADRCYDDAAADDDDTRDGDDRDDDDNDDNDDDHADDGRGGVNMIVDSHADIKSLELL